MAGHAGVQVGDHVGGLEHPPRGGGNQQPGMVVDDVEDLDLPATGEHPVGHVGLPQLVGQPGSEAAPGGAWPLARLRGDKATPAQHPPDRRHARARPDLLPAQVPGNGLRARVVAGIGELLTQLDDPGLQRLIDDPARVRVRSPGPRLESCLTLDQITLDQCAHPLPRHPVLPSHLALRAALHDHGSDQDPSHRHRTSPPLTGWQRCRETPGNYVVNSDTARRAVLNCRFTRSGVVGSSNRGQIGGELFPASRR